MELLVIWLVCAVVAASIYAQKRRSALLGFLAGLILGPLGVVLALASGRGHTARCPFCQETIDKKASICPRCRSSLMEVA